MRLSASVLSALLLMPITAMADDPPPPPPQQTWTGSGQAGFLASQGNSDARSANAMIDMAYYDSPWKHALHLDALYGQTAGLVAAERWNARWQSDYALTERIFAFGAVRYQHDLFNGFQYQASETAGVGYKILETDATKLEAQAGLGYRELRPELITKTPTQTYRTLLPSSSGVVGVFGASLSQVLSPTATVTDKLAAEFGSGNSLITNALALNVKISTKLALSLGFTVQDNTSPPAGLKKLDEVETINLVYSF